MTEAKRLFIARSILGLELRELGSILNVNYSYISKMESGERKVTKTAKRFTEQVIREFVAGEVEKVQGTTA